MVSADHMDLQSIPKQDSSCQFASQERLELSFSIIRLKWLCFFNTTEGHFSKALNIT